MKSIDDSYPLKSSLEETKRRPADRSASVSLLPNELVCHILRCCRSSQWPYRRLAATSQYFEDLIDPIGWVVVTHVCQRWRRIALSDADLWSHLNGDIPLRWLEVMLQRARNALLMLRFDMNHHNHSLKQSLFLHVLSKPEKWKSMSLKLDCHSRTPLAAVENLETPAPNITTLSISSQGGQATMLPINLFSGYAPSLRQLKLEGCLLPWGSRLFQTLTTLQIVLPIDSLSTPDPDSTVDPQELAGLFLSLPDLQHLELEMEFPDMGSSAQDLAFKFSSLVSLRLVGACAQVAGLLARLRVKHSTRIQLCVESCQDASLSILRAAIGQVLYPDRPSPRCLRIQDHDGERFGTNITTFLTADDIEADAYLLSISMVQSIREAMTGDCQPSIRHLLGVTSWDGVETVLLSRSFGKLWDKAQWRAILDVMKPTQELRLAYSAAAEFVGALLDSMDGTAFHLPRLHTLVISNVNIVVAYHHLARYRPRMRDLTVATEQIKDILQARQSVRGSAKLKSLAFARCWGELSEVNLEHLRASGSVDVVLWDGVENEERFTIFDFPEEEEFEEGCDHTSVGEDNGIDDCDDDVGDEYWFGHQENGEGGV